jgi:hypothetical protein
MIEYGLIEDGIMLSIYYPPQAHLKIKRYSPIIVGKKMKEVGQVFWKASWKLFVVALEHGICLGLILKLDNILSSHIFITINCTRHTYLTSGHLRLLLFQNTTGQLFLKNPFIKAHTPCSITAHVYTLAAPIQPTCTYKSMEKGKLLMEHTALGKLTKPFDHAWPVIRPNT